MKKAISWILLILGGLFCFEGVVCAPTILFTMEDGLIPRLIMSLCFVVLAIVGFFVCRAGFRMLQRCASAARPAVKTAASAAPVPPAPNAAKESPLRPAIPRKSPEEEAEFEAARAKTEAMYKEFLSGEGRLPDGFSEPYNTHLPGGYIFRGTPFDAYLRKIASEVDSLRDRSGISDWLFMDETAGPDAAREILAWVGRHREMRKHLLEKCRIGNTTIMAPVSPYCTEKVMVVMASDAPFRAFPPEDIEKCRESGVSFCTNLTETTLFDLTEQEGKWISHTSYPNYHDETYADWFFQ